MDNIITTLSEGFLPYEVLYQEGDLYKYVIEFKEDFSEFNVYEVLHFNKDNNLEDTRFEFLFECNIDRENNFSYDFTLQHFKCKSELERFNKLMYLSWDLAIQKIKYE